MNNESPAVEHVKQSAIAHIMQAAQRRYYGDDQSPLTFDQAIGQQIDRVLASQRQVDASGGPDYSDRAQAMYDRFLYPKVFHDADHDQLVREIAIELATLDGQIRREIERDQSPPTDQAGRQAWAENILDSITPTILDYTGGVTFGNTDRGIMITQIMARLPQAQAQPQPPITLTAAEAAQRIMGKIGSFMAGPAAKVGDGDRLKAEIAQMIATIQAEARAEGATASHGIPITHDAADLARRIMAQFDTRHMHPASAEAIESTIAEWVQTLGELYAARQADMGATAQAAAASMAQAARIQALIDAGREAIEWIAGIAKAENLGPGMTKDEHRQAGAIVHALDTAIADIQAAALGEESTPSPASAKARIHVHVTFDDLKPQIEKLISAHIRRLTEEQ